MIMGFEKEFIKKIFIPKKTDYNDNKSSTAI